MQVPLPKFGPPVNDVDRWFERTARGRNRVPSLFASLLTGRVFTYLAYRLRYPLVLATVQFGVHVAEFFVILSSLGGVAAFTVMMLRVGSLVIGGAWWGLLEIMRDRLRGFSRSGERDAAGYEIGSWLVLAVTLTVTTTVGGAVALVMLHPSGDDPVAHLYAFLIIVEFAINFPVRVVHSGVYATRRVYRPRWSIFLAPVVQLAVLSIGFYYYPTVAIVIAIIVSNAIAIAITIHYSLETYRLIGLAPRLRAHWRRFWRQFPKIPPWQGLKDTVSGLGLRLDGVFVLAIVGIYGTNTRSFDLTAAVAEWRHVDTFRFFYLVLPLFRGSYESAGIFYFDFVRLRSDSALYELRRTFFHRLLCAAPVTSLYFWALAAALGMFFLHDIPLTFLLALIPLFLVRSVIGIYQIRLFAEGRSGTHLATMLFLVVLLWLIWIKPNPASDLIQITAAMILQLILLINVQHLQDRRYPPPPTLLSLGDWLHRLAREPGPVRVGDIAIPESATTKQRSAAVRLMRHTFDGNGHVAFQSPRKLTYYERTTEDSPAAPPHLLLQTLSGGAVNRGTSSTTPITNGRDAFRQWVPQDGVVTAPVDLPALVAEFRSLFPDGIVFDLENLAGAREMRDLDPDLLVRAVPAVTRSLEDGVTTVVLSERRLTPIYQHGALRLLLISPPDPDTARSKDLATAVRAWQISGAAKWVGDA
ncbi:hypothetical protein ORI20_19170 [Mycobacterium sp. CVI_P3]|uniref:Uncharacterized protein n=1 Tax=Mycobacterium pinniadriaticum TaxID=2994102 RepID=A0ABT3SGU8_9MYCO|nr:hypothetical protein [Mycobacterium pinniadriaticum]MCX2932398.1 hypothetical protein [Mycobacterium pinniadriaticum]MCX2938745.1 hypothetical protein [Mycobacterium pinniadriaticum]